jgi:hypothetical protein
MIATSMGSGAFFSDAHKIDKTLSMLFREVLELLPGLRPEEEPVRGGRGRQEYICMTTIFLSPIFLSLTVRCRMRQDRHLLSIMLASGPTLLPGLRPQEVAAARQGDCKLKTAK